MVREAEGIAVGDQTAEDSGLPGRRRGSGDRDAQVHRAFAQPGRDEFAVAAGADGEVGGPGRQPDGEDHALGGLLRGEGEGNLLRRHRLLLEEGGEVHEGLPI
ncbi:hypothetical protein GCM10010299_53260 [Streptomyces tanashiensis]|nr:hypothetical protein GCM10010299_53260 [Streptomyces tanashiensis]